MLEKIKFYLFQSYHRPAAKILHIIVFLKSLFYNKKTNLFSEKMFLLKNPPSSTIYYSFFGRIIFLIINLMSILIFRSYFEKGLRLDNNEKKRNEILEGNDGISWPIQQLDYYETFDEKISDDFYKRLEIDYQNSVKVLNENKFFKKSPWWIKCSDEFKKIFLNENLKLNIEALNNFRNSVKTKAAILADQNFLSSNNSSFINKLKSLSIINLYHKLSEHVDLDILRMCSESRAGNSFCVSYRNQRLSHRVLRYAYYVSQIKKNTSLDLKAQNLFLDIGGGYAGLSRYLKNIYNHSTFVTVELPEVCVLAAYFLKKCFPNKKIATFSDFKDHKKINSEDLREFDFVILPQPMIEKFDNEIFDICINTTSLGEMTNEMQQFYINEIERISKKFFYSVNRPKERIEKFNAQGFYGVKFKKRWKSLIYQFTHTYHIEFLGEKID